MKTTHTSESVSYLYVSACIGESGSITPLPESTEPVRWTAVYRDADGGWQRSAEARAREEAQPLLDDLAAALPPANWHGKPEGWRTTTAQTIRKETHDRVVDAMRREALDTIEALGRFFAPVSWEESHRRYWRQGEWTVTVSVRGTDHDAVREAYAAGIKARRDEILTDPRNRIPRVSGSVRTSADTPEKVRKAWRLDRRNGTAPKPATGAFAPGSWVTLEHPASGETLTGIVTEWTSTGSRLGRGERAVIPSNGDEPIPMTLQGTKPTMGPWRATRQEETWTVKASAVHP
ncbi:hypothetical protein [Streptomyces sp. NPDC050485]|uniref:hypothetical protein n=1 Tax=Streptomyces sp. NPDC050485 TaxID=3365617 RepID=UPI0037B1FE55